MIFRDDYRRLLRRGGLAVWAAVGLPVAGLPVPGACRGIADSRPLGGVGRGAWLLFGVAFERATARRRIGSPGRPRAGRGPDGRGPRPGGSSAVLRARGNPSRARGPSTRRPAGTARRLRLDRRSRARRCSAVVWMHWGWHWGVVLAFAYFPFQVIADATTRLLVEETAARERLAAANAELESARALLARTTRLAERARIARDLHDLLGHHLTALSLNLEVASHLSEGDARRHVETAQSITKLLLGDVRGVVDALRQDPDVDLPAALRNLGDGIPRPRIHIEVAPELAVEDPGAGEVILRCAQEIVTNAVRHARAENVWLEIDRSGADVRIEARDDGCGAQAVRSGNGLLGLRERFEQRGGAFSFATAPGRGFRVTAVLRSRRHRRACPVAAPRLRDSRLPGRGPDARAGGNSQPAGAGPRDRRRGRGQRRRRGARGDPGVRRRRRASRHPPSRGCRGSRSCGGCPRPAGFRRPSS